MIHKPSQTVTKYCDVNLIIILNNINNIVIQFYQNLANLMIKKKIYQKGELDSIVRGGYGARYVFLSKVIF